MLKELLQTYLRICLEITLVRVWENRLLCSVFRVLIRWIKCIQRPANALGFMDVILLNIGHQHVPRHSRWPLMGMKRIQE